VHLRYVDLSIELQVLGFYRARSEDIGREAAAADGSRLPLMRSVGMSPGPELG